MGCQIDNPITIDVNDTVNDSQSTKEPEPKQTAPEPKQSEPEPKGLAPFVDESRDPQSYVDRYNTEASYKKWFDENYPQYSQFTRQWDWRSQRDWPHLWTSQGIRRAMWTGTTQRPATRSGLMRTIHSTPQFTRQWDWRSQK